MNNVDVIFYFLTKCYFFKRKENTWIKIEQLWMDRLLKTLKVTNTIFALSYFSKRRDCETRSLEAEKMTCKSLKWVAPKWHTVGQASF